MKLTLLLYFLLAWASTHAQSQLVFTGFDLNPGGDSSPFRFCEANGKMFFIANNPASGQELWVSDGTKTGTQLLKDINPGTANGSIYGLIAFNNKLYFSANDGIHGTELWVTDGTTAGTQLLKDINPGSGISSFHNAAVYNNHLLFAAKDGTNGIELWITDGTTSGTKMVKDINPCSADSHPANITVFNGKAYFAARGTADGTELWVTDGTEQGTQQFMDVNPGKNGSQPRPMLATANKLFFSANTDDFGSELWATDGTPAGTQMIKDINPGSAHGFSSNRLTAHNGKYYFSGNNSEQNYELWVTDGTATGTQLVADIWPGPIGGNPASITSFNGKLYMSATDGDIGLNGYEVWVSDGTQSGTHILAYLAPSIESLYPSNFTVYKNTLFFTGNQSVTDRQLYKTDGTRAGTSLISPPGGINHSPLSSASTLFLYNSALYFSASFNDIGDELWEIKETPPDPGSVSNVKNSPSFSVFPNPAEGSFTITGYSHFATQGSVRVYDVTGKTIYTQDLQPNSTVVSPTNITPGVYMVELQTDKGKSTTQLIVQ